MIPNCDYYSTILQDITFEPTIQDPKIALDQQQRRFHQIPSNLTEKHRLECPTSPQKQQQSKMKFSKFFGLTSRTPTSSTNVEEAKAAEDRMGKLSTKIKKNFPKKLIIYSALYSDIYSTLVKLSF